MSIIVDSLQIPRRNTLSHEALLIDTIFMINIVKEEIRVVRIFHEKSQHETKWVLGDLSLAIISRIMLWLQMVKAIRR